MDPFEEVKLFLKINTEQVKVSRNLVNEIYAGGDITADDPSERLSAIGAKIVVQLDLSGPFKGKIKTEVDKKSRLRCITLTNFVDGLFENGLVGAVVKSTTMISPGVLMDPTGDPNRSLVRATAILKSYFGIFASGAEEHWNLGDTKGGYLATRELPPPVRARWPGLGQSVRENWQSLAVSRRTRIYPYVHWSSRAAQRHV